ncbi:MAG: hypothetical protein QOI31_1726 [Solirubrobacterales bacterium]|jgi:tetratricopeptide (TPR) repeat protein|nr:hypothetical protein [Solirubrobacterales bacterium]
MADKITIQRSFFGDALTARVPSTDHRPSLSFADSAALQRTAFEASETRQVISRGIGSLEGGLGEVADAVAGLERSLGLHLEEQVDELRKQTDLLRDVRDAVLTPNRTRGAERAADAAKLLSRGRYERALQVATEGIEADPNNPAVFFAAGWAYAGLDDSAQAQAMFEEARDAADGDECSRAARQAARAALIGGRNEIAYQLVRDARAIARSPEEKAAVAYDVGVCAWLNGDPDTSVDSVREAFEYDTRFCQMALIDQAFEAADEIRQVATDVLSSWNDRVKSERAALETSVATLRAEIPGPPELERTYQELGQAFRPPRNSVAVRQALIGTVTSVATEITASQREDSLQSAQRRLGEASSTLARAQGSLSTLNADIAAHEEADTRHTLALLEKYGHDRTYEFSQRFVEPLSRLPDVRLGTLFFLALCVMVVGLFVGIDAVTLGVVVVLVWILGLGVRSMESQRADRARRQAAEIQAKLDS